MSALESFFNTGIPNAALLQRRGLDIYAIMHFGLNTYTGREWGFGDESPSLFDPPEFDAGQIAGACAESGVQGLILVCKHHDGFCLWPTRTTPHNISKSPFRNGRGDLVREMSDACRKAGIKFGVYVSPWDRNNPHYGTPRYVEIYHEQLREVLTNYGPVFEAWFDGANGGTGFYGGANEERRIDKFAYYDWPAVWSMVRRLQPGACIFSDVGPELRWAGNETGILDPECRCSFTPSLPPGVAGYPAPGHIDQAILGTGTPRGRFWMQPECDFPLRPGWFYHEAEDTRQKSSRHLLNVYLRSVGCGGTMNIGIAPDKRGLLHDNDVRALAGFHALRNQLFADLRGTAGLLPHAAFHFSEPVEFDTIVMEEDIACGERVDAYELCVLDNDAWRVALSGHVIGQKRIRLIAPVRAEAVRLDVRGHDVKPVALRLYKRPASIDIADDTTIDSLDATIPMQLVNQTHDMLVFRYDGAARLRGFRFTPVANAAGTPLAYALDVSADNTTWQSAAKGEFSNIMANPVAQDIIPPLPMDVVTFVRLTALRKSDPAAELVFQTFEALPG